MSNMSSTATTLPRYKLQAFVLSLMLATNVSAFFFRTPLVGVDDTLTAVALPLVKIATLLAMAAYAYTHRLSVRSLSLAFIAVACLFITFDLTMGAAHPALLSVTIGCLSGVTHVLLTVPLAGLPPLYSRLSFFAGMGLGTLLHMAGQYFSPNAVVGFQTIALLILLALFALYLLLQGDKETLFEPVRDIVARYRVRHKILFALTTIPRKILVITYAGLALFSFCYGIFEVYAQAEGASFSNTGAALITVVVACALSCLASLQKGIRQRFDAYVGAVGAVCVAVFVFLLVFMPNNPLLFTILSAGYTILQLCLISFFVEASADDHVSPAFRLGLYSATIMALRTLGQVVAAVALRVLDLGDFFVPQAISVVTTLVVGLLVFKVIFDAYRLDTKVEDAPEAVLPRQDVRDAEPPTNPPVTGIVSDTPNQPASPAGEPTTLPLPLDAFVHAYGLTVRERDIVGLYSQGNTVRSISGRLYLSESTVRSYIRQTYQKAGVHSRQELIDAIAKMGETNTPETPA